MLISQGYITSKVFIFLFISPVDTFDKRKNNKDWLLIAWKVRGTDDIPGSTSDSVSSISEKCVRTKIVKNIAKAIKVGLQSLRDGKSTYKCKPAKQVPLSNIMMKSEFDNFVLLSLLNKKAPSDAPKK